MTVVPVNTEALRKKAKEDAINAFKTPKGWTYPGKKTMIESNVHPKKPDSFRSKEVYTVDSVIIFYYFQFRCKRL